MSIGREARTRANNRRQRIEAATITEGDLRQILECWRKEAEYRARVAFVGHPDGASRIVPAVWDLYRRKLIEATALGIHEELAEICRQAIAKYIGTGTTRLGTSMLGPGVRLVTVRA